MDQFLKEYTTIMNAVGYGHSNKPVVFEDTGKIRNDLSPKKFIAECHRGYEKVQNRVISSIENIRKNDELSNNEKEYRELVLRKIIDHIAFSLLKYETHVARRLGTLNEIQKNDIKTIKEAQKEANKFNHESRQTFALLCDLTTFITVCDILRIDCRTKPPEIKYIELKSGKVNEILLDKIDEYDVDIASINLIKNNGEIDLKYKKQAIRMMNQRIRLHNIQDIIKNDYGIDQDTQKKIVMGENTLQEHQYGDFLNNLLKSAKENSGKIVSGMVNYCIHLGACFTENYETSLEGATKGALYSLSEQVTVPPEGLLLIKNKLLSLSKVSEKDIYFGSDLFQTNLNSIGVLPFQAWFLDRDIQIDLISKKLCVIFIFDLPAFIWLSRKMGLHLDLSSRKVANKIKKDVGSHNVITFANRLIEYPVNNEKGHLLSLISRFFTNLSSPIDIISHFQKELDETFSKHIDL